MSFGMILRCCIWIAALSAYSLRMDGSIIKCTYDAAGRLVGMQYGATTNSVIHYDESGSILDAGTFTTRAPELSVTQAVIPENPLSGVPFKIVITGANVSGASASGVRLTVEFSPGYNLISVRASTGTLSFNNSRVDCDIGSLDPGDHITIEITAWVTTEDFVSHTVTIAGAGDLNSANNAEVRTIAVEPGPVLQVTRLPGLITWPATADGFRLEETASLKPPVLWTPSASGDLVGDLFRIPVDPGAGTRFYRLRN